MRVKLETPAKSAGYGKKRIKVKFLLFPKLINRELRWLEKTMWVQQVDYRIYEYDYGLTKVKKYFWRDIEWLDKYGEEKSVGEWLDI